MAPDTKQKFISLLQGAWTEYVQEFQHLSPEQQSAFLSQQGYKRFADLLAHIVAWWQAGSQSVERYLRDPNAQPISYDVDAFNAEAVTQAAGLDEDQVIESFESMRCFLIEFLEGLPDSVFENRKVIDQLDMDITGHLSEHKMIEKA